MLNQSIIGAGLLPRHSFGNFSVVESRGDVLLVLDPEPPLAKLIGGEHADWSWRFADHGTSIELVGPEGCAAFDLRRTRLSIDAEFRRQMSTRDLVLQVGVDDLRPISIRSASAFADSGASV